MPGLEKDYFWRIYTSNPVNRLNRKGSAQPPTLGEG